jgi:hypothetical protein
MHNFSEKLLQLEEQTEANIEAIDKISLDESVEPSIKKLQARICEIKNLLCISSLWDNNPPVTPEEIKDYMVMVKELRDRIWELTKNPMCAGKHEEFIK